MSLLTYVPRLRPSAGFLNALAILFAVAGIAVAGLLLRHGPSDGFLSAVALDNKAIPMFMVVGTITFQVFFNLIDMQIGSRLPPTVTSRARSNARSVGR